MINIPELLGKRKIIRTIRSGLEPGYDVVRGHLGGTEIVWGEGEEERVNIESLGEVDSKIAKVPMGREVRIVFGEKLEVRAVSWRVVDIREYNRGQ